MYETIIKNGMEYKLVPIKPEKKNRVLFTLSMPCNNSWNNKWSGDDRFYCISKVAFRRNKPVYPNLKEGNYIYGFEDGWVANVNVKFVTPSEAKAAMKKSDGFCGYEWMCDELMATGKISTRQEKLKKLDQILIFNIIDMDNNEVLDYILKRYHTNRIKYRSQRSTIAETDYAKHAIIELRKILKHFNVKYKAL